MKHTRLSTRALLSGMAFMAFWALALSGCASSTGVVPMDQGTYSIAKRSPQVSFGPPVTQKADVYTEANAFCRQQAKVVETIKLDEVHQVFGRHGSASLTFRCVATNK